MMSYNPFMQHVKFVIENILSATKQFKKNEAFLLVS